MPIERYLVHVEPVYLAWSSNPRPNKPKLLELMIVCGCAIVSVGSRPRCTLDSLKRTQMTECYIERHLYGIFTANTVATHDTQSTDSLHQVQRTYVKVASNPMYLMQIWSWWRLISKHTKFSRISTQNDRTSWSPHSRNIFDVIFAYGRRQHTSLHIASSSMYLKLKRGGIKDTSFRSKFEFLICSSELPQAPGNAKNFQSYYYSLHSCA